MNEQWILLGSVCLIGLVFILMPKPIRQWMASTISLNKFGIRYSNWRRDRIDTLTNFFLFLSFLFSIIAPFIPYGIYIFCGLFMFAFLCLMGQTYRISEKEKASTRLSIVIAIVLMSVVAHLSATILVRLNGLDPLTQFLKDVQEGNIYYFAYWVTRYEPILLLNQMACYLAAFYVVWAQFKYMRLENHYKATKIGFLWFKIILVCLLLVANSLGFVYLVNMVYYL